MVRMVLAAAVVFAVAAPCVSAATVQDVSRTVAGYDADVQCLSDSEWRTLLDTTGRGSWTSGMAGITWPDLHRARFPQSVCDAISQGTGNPSLVLALQIVAHEASHLRGVTSERVAECWGMLWVADLAQRFYGVEFFTLQSDTMIATAVYNRSVLPAEYQGSCG